MKYPFKHSSGAPLWWKCPHCGSMNDDDVCCKACAAKARERDGR